MPVTYWTVTGVVLAADNVTVKLAVEYPELPSGTLLMSSIVMVGTVFAPSSLVMVPVAEAVPSVAPTGPDNVTVNVSSDSTAVSPITLMFTV